MKTSILISLSVILGINVQGAEIEKPIKTKPEKVIVYKNGAQIFRQAQVNLIAGENKIIFDMLEEGVSANSIQAGGNGNFIITETGYFDKMPDMNKLKGDTKYVKMIKQIQDSIAMIDYKQDDIKYRNEVLNTEKNVLLNYRLYKGTSTKDSLSFLKDGLTFLKEKLTSIYIDIHSLKKESDYLYTLKAALQNRLNGINDDLGEENVSSVYKTNHQITISIIADAPTQATLNINYFVSTAGWEPMYDLRTDGVESVVKLTYKGIVYQHTGIDWSNVKLVLSTGNPQCNLSAPELNAWYLDMPRYGLSHQEQFQQMASKSVNSVVPSAAGVYIDANTKSGGTIEREEYKKEEVAKNAYDYTITEDQQVQATFEIKLPYTISSDNKKHTVAIMQKDLETKYVYKTVPKQDVTAYLLARVTGWEDLNLLAGKASVFYAGTYVGQTYINPAVTNDTLDLTLGKDDNVVVKRTKQKDKSKEKFLNNDKVYSFSYEITIKNGNAKNIDIEIKDQLPLSHSKEVIITKENISGANYNETTGVLTWRQTIKSKDTKHLVFSYTVKAPKDLPMAGR